MQASARPSRLSSLVHSRAHKKFDPRASGLSISERAIGKKISDGARRAGTCGAQVVSRDRPHGQTAPLAAGRPQRPRKRPRMSETAREPWGAVEIEAPGRQRAPEPPVAVPGQHATRSAESVRHPGFPVPVHQFSLRAERRRGPRQLGDWKDAVAGPSAAFAVDLRRGADAFRCSRLTPGRGLSPEPRDAPQGLQALFFSCVRQDHASQETRAPSPGVASPSAARARGSAGLCAKVLSIRDPRPPPHDAHMEAETGLSSVLHRTVGRYRRARLGTRSAIW